MSLGQHFLELFQGLMRAHGRYIIPEGTKADDKGKIVAPGGMRVTVAEPVTVDLWEMHLAGTYGLGIVPINEDNKVHFAAIDVDVYPLDLNALEEKIKKLKLPLILCRTKSGGAHLYLFMKEPAPAKLARERLVEWAVALGYPGVEVFPKQIKLSSDTDFGNWINMPYQSGARSTRYAIKDGRAIGPEEFLVYAVNMAITPEELKAHKAPARDPELSEMLDGAPPCLETLASFGVPEGTRNSAMFNFVIYLKKRFPDDFARRAVVFNRRFMTPPLPDRELQTIIGGASAKDYGYKCKDEPICSVCSKDVCKKREFGVGGGTRNLDPGVTLGALRKQETDPPVWTWNINGVDIEFSTEALADQRLFRLRVFGIIHKFPAIVKPDAWEDMLEAAAASAKIIETPADATPEGQVLVHLERFCTSRTVARSLDELMLGKAWTDEVTGRTVFISTDFLQYLLQHRVQGVNEGKLLTMLRRTLDIGFHQHKIKGKPITCWSVPKFTVQNEDYDIPRKPIEEAM